MQLDGLLIEVLHDSVAVMADDPLRNLRRDAVFLGELDAVHHMLADDLGRFVGRNQIVRIADPKLVLDEVGGVLGLAEVVVVGGRQSQQVVGADSTRRLLGQRADHERVVECAPGVLLEGLEGRVVAVCDVEEAKGGGDVESDLEERQGHAGDERREEADHEGEHSRPGHGLHDG